MAAVKKRKQTKLGTVQRVSPLKPGLRGARNWASAQMRAASHTRKGMIRFIASLFGMFCMLAFLALWLSGTLPQLRQSMYDFKVSRLMSMGFVVKQVDVMGEGRLNEADVRSAIGIYPGEYFFGADLDRAQIRTESLPWVDRAVVRRLWPNRIVVQLVETKPYALWQQNGQFSLVSAKGEEITKLQDVRSMPEGLKTLIGPDAPKHASFIEAALEGYPDIWERTESLVHMRGQRWDLYMRGGVKVKLPETDVDIAIKRLADLQDNTQILDRELAAIDLRLSDRVSFTPVTKPKGEQA